MGTDRILITPGALPLSRGYWYLATPYSRYPGGIQEAFEEACRASAWLMKRGAYIFCPIAHTHPIAIHGGIDPLNHAIWLPADTPLMEAAHGLIVCMMRSWEESFGIQAEREYFEGAGKPVRWLEWPQSLGTATGEAGR